MSGVFLFKSVLVILAVKVVIKIVLAARQNKENIATAKMSCGGVRKCYNIPVTNLF